MTLIPTATDDGVSAFGPLQTLISHGPQSKSKLYRNYHNLLCSNEFLTRPCRAIPFHFYFEKFRPLGRIWKFSKVRRFQRNQVFVNLISPPPQNLMRQRERERSGQCVHGQMNGWMYGCVVEVHCRTHCIVVQWPVTECLVVSGPWAVTIT